MLLLAGVIALTSCRDSLFYLSNGLRFRELPGAVEDRLPRAIQPHAVVPLGRRHQAVGRVLRAAAELDRVRPIGAELGGQHVDRV